MCRSYLDHFTFFANAVILCLTFFHMVKVLMRRASGGAYLQEESSFLFQMTGFQLHVEILIYLLNLKSYNKNV